MEAKPQEEAMCNLSIMPTQVTDMLANKPADDSSPQLLSHPQTKSSYDEVIDIVEQR